MTDKTKLQIEYIPVSEIQPYENNPRKNDKAVETVKKSIQEFGFKNPIILDKDNKIVAGHTRLKASKDLNYSEVPVIWADDLTEEQVKAFRIMDNKSHEFSDWDYEALKVEFERLETDFEFDTDFTGFDKKEISQLYDSQNQAEEDNFDTEKAQKEPKYKIQKGDIYGLGAYIEINGKKYDVKIL